MKLTTIAWNNVQLVLDEMTDEPALRLNSRIEDRTWGKRWSQDVAIKLTKPEQHLVDGILAGLAKEEGVCAK